MTRMEYLKTNFTNIINKKQHISAVKQDAKI
jgi:hypothetical protein